MSVYVFAFGIAKMVKIKKPRYLRGLWYSVGESNPYCKIENLEY